MSENKINWWLIIGIVVVVAVLASFITLQVTGNVVSVVNSAKTSCVNSCYTTECANGSTLNLRNQCKARCSTSCSKTEVYTKAEVDALLADINSEASNVSFGSESYLIRFKNFQNESIGGLSVDVERYQNGYWYLLNTDAEVGDLVSIGNMEIDIQSIDLRTKVVSFNVRGGYAIMSSRDKRYNATNIDSITLAGYE